MKRGAVPLFMQVKADMLKKISSGQWKPGDKLQPEREQAKAYGVSRITIVRAFSELQEEGYLKRLQGSGTFVADAGKPAGNDFPGILSCSRRATRITFGIRDNSQESNLLYRMLANEFQLANPDIAVEIAQIPHAPRAEDDAYLLRMASGNLPTVGEFYLHADYAALNGLINLEEMPGFAELVQDMNQLYLHATVNARGESRIHALPHSLSSRCMLINLDLARSAGLQPDAPPRTWSGLQEWCGILGEYTRRRRGEYYGLALELPRGWHGVISYYPFLWGQTPPPKENSFADFLGICRNNADGGWLAFVADLLKNGNPCMLDNPHALFALGRVGLLPSTVPWAVKLRKILGSTFAVTATPIPGPDGPARSVAGGFSLGIFTAAIRSEEQRLAAWKWIKFLLQPDVQSLGARTSMSVPVTTGADAPMRADPLLRVFVESLEHAVPQYDFRGIRRVLRIMGSEIRKSLYEQADPAACMQRCMQRLENEEIAN